MIQLAQLSRVAWLQLQGLGGGLQRCLLRLDRAFPLSVKVMVPLAVLAVAVAALVIWLEYRSLRGHFDEMYRERGLLLAQTLQADISERPFGEHLDDPFDLYVSIERLQTAEPSLRRVNIYVPDAIGSRIVASTVPSLIGVSDHETLPLSFAAPIVEETTIGDEKALEVVAPLTEDGLTVGAVGIYMSLAERDAALWSMTVRIVAIPLVTVTAGLLLIWLPVRLLVVGRLRKLTRAGERLRVGDLSARVPGSWDQPGRDEIASAVSQFNRMASSLQDLAGRLQRQAMIDSLTGLHSRRYFDQTLPAEMERAQRLGHPLALMVLDLDRFKLINDRHGHAAGDEALRQLATLMQRNIRPMDTLARYGGDEFVLILPGSDLEEATAAAERLRALLAAAPLACDCCSVSASVGVAVYPRHAATADDLVRVADTALYAAKRGSSDFVVAAAEAG